MLILYIVSMENLLPGKQDSNISSYHAGFLMTMWRNEHGKQLGKKNLMLPSTQSANSQAAHWQSISLNLFKKYILNKPNVY